MVIERKEELVLTPNEEGKIQELLQQSFTNFPKDRIYYKQIPSFRLLAWDDNELLGQAGIVFRIISLDGIPYKILGVMDLCVAEAFRHKKVASTILQRAEQIAKDHRIDFILLFADDHRFYLNNGFQIVSNTCKWVMIKDFQTFGIVHRKINQSLLVKAVGETPWKNEVTADFMGFVF